VDTLVDLVKNYPDQINTLAAVCALIVSLLSIILTFLALALQRRHNFKSLTPIASIPIGDYENELTVKIRNTGVGPLIVEQFIAFDESQEKDDIISWMPETPEGINWTTFYDDLDGLCIAPNQDAVIIKLSGDPSDKRFVSFRNEVRRALSRLTVKVKYKDIYDRQMPIKQRELKWFARHFGNQ